MAFDIMVITRHMHVFLPLLLIYWTVQHVHPFFDVYVCDSVGVIHSDIHDENLILANNDDKTFGDKRENEAWSQYTETLESHGDENNVQTKITDSSQKQLNKPTTTTAAEEECISDNKSVKLQFGIIDFADIMYTCSVFELAASVAYAMMQEDTNGEAYVNRGRCIIQGYLSVLELCDLEKNVLFVCVCSRYCIELVYGQLESMLQGDEATHVLNPCEKEGWEQLSNLIHLGPSKVYECWFN